MSVAKVYIHIKEGDGPFTRTVLPQHLVEHYKIKSIELSGPDEVYPSKYPAAKVPAALLADGTQLMESIPIALLIVDQIPNNGGLYGKGTPAEFAQILRWMSIFNFDFMESVTVPFKMVVGRLPFDKSVWDSTSAAYLKEIGLFEKHFVKNTYLVGESVTLADLYGACFFLRPLAHLWDKEFRAKYPATMRWFETVKAHPVFNGFFDSLKYLDTFKMPVS